MANNFWQTRTAIGVAKNTYTQKRQLENNLILRFEKYNMYALGYYQLLINYFEEFAKRRNERFRLINANIHIKPNELTEFLLCIKNAENFHDARYPDFWEEFVGTAILDGSPEREMKPVLAKSMLKNILKRLRKLAIFAKENDRDLVFCNGVMYLVYFDIKLPKGTQIYS